ncbi:MAG: hypothetical protein LBE13_16325 [Bacteroidales bacterium]|jgi:hypothetical protein|nr:hypothetical protein [Bacteroidales bacterium]
MNRKNFMITTVTFVIFLFLHCLCYAELPRGISPVVIVSVEQSVTTFKRTTNEPRGHNDVTAHFTITGFLNLGLTSEAKYEYKQNNTVKWSWQLRGEKTIPGYAAIYPRITPTRDTTFTASLIASTIYVGACEQTIVMTATYDILDTNGNVIVKDQQTSGVGIITLIATDTDIRVNIKPTDHFAGRSLKRFGIGETGTFSVIGSDNLNPVPAKFSLNTYGINDVLTLTNINENTGTTQFRAGSNAGKATLTVTSKITNKTINYDFTVIKPESIIFSYRNRIFEPAISRPIPSIPHIQIEQYIYGFTADCYIAPYDVSFSSLKIKEGVAECTSSANLTSWKSQHKEWVAFVDVISGSLVTGCQVKKKDNTNAYKFDIIYFTLPTMHNNSWIAWEKIPWNYFVNNLNNQTIKGTVSSVSQRADVVNKITTVTKGNLKSPPLDVINQAYDPK